MGVLNNKLADVCFSSKLYEIEGRIYHTFFLPKFRKIILSTNGKMSSVIWMIFCGRDFEALPSNYKSREGDL